MFNQDEMDCYTQMELARMAYERHVLDMTQLAGPVAYELHIGAKLYTDLGRHIVGCLVHTFVCDNVREEHFRDIYPVAYGTEEPRLGEDEIFSAQCVYNNPESPHHGKKVVLTFFKDFDGTLIVQATWEGEIHYINPR
jgi:hypothetical protein